MLRDEKLKRVPGWSTRRQQRGLKEHEAESTAQFQASCQKILKKLNQPAWNRLLRSPHPKSFLSNDGSCFKATYGVATWKNETFQPQSNRGWRMETKD